MTNLRKFAAGDWGAVREIEKDSFLDGRPRPLEKYLREHPKEFIVAENEKKIVGYIAGRIKHDSSATIAFLAVTPAFRRRGIGQKLSAYLISHFKRKGMKEILVCARVNNEPSISLYRKLGFEIVKKIEGYYRNGDDAFVMKKYLDKMAEDE